LRAWLSALSTSWKSIVEVTSNDDWNEAYYSKKVLAPDVLIRGSVSNKGAAGLLAATAAAAKK